MNVLFERMIVSSSRSPYALATCSRELHAAEQLGRGELGGNDVGNRLGRRVEAFERFRIGRERHQHV
jgi:hypothetical protein